jgi:hypothetical protein
LSGDFDIIHRKVEPLRVGIVSASSMSLRESVMLFYPWYPAMMLAFEACNVIDMRLWKIARGGTEGAAESHLMVKEKVEALVEAGSVLARGGNSAHVIDIYRKHVAANALRLEHV